MPKSKALVQPFGYVFGVAAVQMVMNIRIFLLQLPDDFSNLPDSLRLAAADVNIAAYGVFPGQKLRFRLVDHGNDFFSPLAQPHPFRRKDDAMALSHQELTA